MYTECETSIGTKPPSNIFCVKHIHLQAERMSHLHDFDNMYRWKSQNVVRFFFSIRIFARFGCFAKPNSNIECMGVLNVSACIKHIHLLCQAQHAEFKIQSACSAGGLLFR